MCGKGIATRDCSGGNGSDELASRSLVEGCGQGALASIDMCPFGADRPKEQPETFPACMSVPGIPQGQPSYRRALFASRACDTVETGLI